MLHGFESDDNAMDGGKMRGKKLIRERLQPPILLSLFLLHGTRMDKCMYSKTYFCIGWMVVDNFGLRE